MNFFIQNKNKIFTILKGASKYMGGKGIKKKKEKRQFYVC
jgi:hypothetical protein